MQPNAPKCIYEQAKTTAAGEEKMHNTPISCVGTHANIEEGAGPLQPLTSLPVLHGNYVFRRRSIYELPPLLYKLAAFFETRHPFITSPAEVHPIRLTMNR